MDPTEMSISPVTTINVNGQREERHWSNALKRYGDVGRGKKISRSFPANQKNGDEHDEEEDLPPREESSELNHLPNSG